MDRQLSNAGVSATVTSFGAMTTVGFELDGATVRPLYEAPWDDYDGAPLIANLRGDFSCVPFGIAPESLADFPAGWRELDPGTTPYAHGYAANTEWETEWVREDSARLRLNYPADDAVAWIARQVTCTPDAVEFVDEISVRRDVRLPLGLHPMLRLPEEVGAATLDAPECEAMATFLVPTDASSVLQPDAWFDELSAAPLKAGGSLDLTQLPLAGNLEELVQLCGVTRPSASLVNHAEGYRVTLEWDSSLLKHCLLWISNRGRSASPWDGRNLCLGIEPIASAFDLGTLVAGGPNPLTERGFATAVDLTAGEVVAIRHRISVARA